MLLFFLFFIPFVFQHLSFPTIPITLCTVVSVQCVFSETSGISTEATKWWWLHVFGKSILYLIKQKYSNKTRCRLLKSVCWSKDDAWPKNVLFAALPVSKPSVCVRLECVSGKCRPKPSPFFKYCCKGEFMPSAWGCWEDVSPSADYQTAFLLFFFLFTVPYRGCKSCHSPVSGGQSKWRSK